MKKTLTRVLSLVMVLAMFVSAMPLAMAEGETITAVTAVSPASLELEVGEAQQLTATYEPTTAAADLDWASTSSAIASVDANGLVTANGVGQCQIWARSKADNNIKAISYITVVEAEEEEEDDKYTPVFSFTTLTMNIGDKHDLPTVTIGDLEEGTDYELTWAVSRNSGLALTEDGRQVEAIGSKSGKIGVKVTPKGNMKESDFTTLEIYCDVTISDELALSLSTTKIELAEDGRDFDLEEPKLVGEDADEYEIRDYYYELEEDRCESVELHNDTLRPVTAGRDTLTLSARVVNKDTGRSVSVPDVTINVSVYKEADDIVAYLKDNVNYFTFDSTTALEELTLGGVDYSNNAFADTVEALLNEVNTEINTDRGNYANYTLYFKDVDGAGGTLSTTTGSNLETRGIAMSALDKVKFTRGKTSAQSAFRYTITDDQGLTMTIGTLYIDYEGTDAIVYETDFETAVTFDESDFYEFYEDSGKSGSLSYVTFDGLPGSREGDLYTTSSQTTEVSKSDKFYYNASSSQKDLDKVTFVPNDGRTSEYTVSIPFTAYSSSTRYVDGYVTIFVSEDESTGDIEYTTELKTSVTFKEEDFEEFWEDNTTSGSLSYVKFTKLPTSTYGVLYTTTKETTKVTISDKFQPNYKSSSSYDDLDTVTFKPSSTRTSAYTVEIPFTAYGTNNKDLDGTVIIEVGEDAATGDTITSLGIYLGHTGYKFDEEIADEYKEEKNKDLEYVTFIQPSVEEGRLYYDYESLMDNKEVTSKVEFYYEADKNQEDLADVWFIPAAGFKGTVKLKYTAYGKNGSSEYDGVLVLKVSSKTKSTYFNDVTASSYSWASDSVDFLRYNEIVNGTNDANTQFSPKNSITRAHFMLMLYRAFLADDYGSKTITSNFNDITKGTSAYSKELYQAVGVAKSLGIATGDGTNYYPNKNISRQEAMTLIYRTLDKLDLSLEYTGTKSTSSFSDYSKVTSYAKEPLKYLIDHGVVVGDSGKINPTSNITRAEMAVILHRVLTY